MIIFFFFNFLKNKYNEVYISIIRSILGLITSFFLSLFFGKKLIFYFKKLNLKQKIKKENILHDFKYKIPTMGGILIIITSIISIIIWSNLNNYYIWYVLLSFLIHAFIGFIDDFIKIYNKNYCGFTIKNKYIIQSLFSFIIFFLIYKTENSNLTNKIYIPFVKSKYININKYLYFIITYFTNIGSINAVNLTDGLDGLATITLINSLISAIIISFISCNLYLSNYFNFIYIPNSYELIVISSIFIGSLLGFLWFNSYPSEIFMGDTGSLSLGGILSMIFILLRSELLLLISGGLFVIEAMSVITQVIYFKLYKKRIYLMSPLHHHYEIKGMHESKIVTRFYIISTLLNIINFLIIGVKIGRL